MQAEEVSFMLLQALATKSQPSLHVDTDDSASDTQIVPSKSKKCKSTYYHRKDEIETLQEQIRALQDQLARFHGKPTHCEVELRDSRILTAKLEADIERNVLRLAGTESMLSAYQRKLRVDAPLPLNTYIHLPIENVKRNDILYNMRAHKLRVAHRFMQERTRFLDLSQRHYQIETFDYPNGDIAHMSFNATVFDPAHSLREVYEEFLYFIHHQEITVTEKLGVLTVRETDEFDQAKFFHTRFLTTLPEGLEVEWNAAMFSALFGRTQDSPGYVIACTDFVDRDDLYPFRPYVCGRKEITAAIMMKEVETSRGRAISMTRWSFVRFRQPDLEVPDAIRELVRANMIEWCDLIAHVTAERLTARKRAAEKE